MPKVGDQIPVSLQLFDGATNKFVRAHVYDADQAEIDGSPFACTHLAGGLYQSLAAVMPDTDEVYVQFKVYTDSGFTTLSTVHGDALDIFLREDSSLPGPAIMAVVESVEPIGAIVEPQEPIIAVVEDC